MDSHKSWKIKFSLLMVVLIIIIYGSNYLVLGDAEHIISYIWTHLDFIHVVLYVLRMKDFIGSMQRIMVMIIYGMIVI